MLAKPFYWSTTRSLTVVFGSLFNDIHVVRKNSDDTENRRFLVPISYGPKNTWVYNKQNNNDTSSSPVVKSLLPAMTFEMSGMQYNETRKTNTLNIMASNITGDGNNKSKMFAPVPYDFSFTLIVYSKYIEDGLQIVEQIIPYFAPSLNVKIKEMSEPLVYNDVQVTLEDVTSEDNFEDALDNTRLLTWSFNFSVSANVYPPIDPAKIIRKSIVNIDNSLITPAATLESIQTTAHTHETSNITHSDTVINNTAPLETSGIFNTTFSDEFL